MEVRIRDDEWMFWKQVSGPLPRWKTLNKVWETWCWLVRVKTSQSKHNSTVPSFQIQWGKNGLFHTAQLDRPSYSTITVRSKTSLNKSLAECCLPSWKLAVTNDLAPLSTKHAWTVQDSTAESNRPRRLERKTSRQKKSLAFWPYSFSSGDSSGLSLLLISHDLVRPSNARTNTHPRPEETDN